MIEKINIQTVIAEIDNAKLSQKQFELIFCELNGKIRKGIFTKPLKGSFEKKLDTKKPFHSISKNRLVFVQELGSSHPINIKLDLILYFNGKRVIQKWIN